MRLSHHLDVKFHFALLIQSHYILSELDQTLLSGELWIAFTKQDLTLLVQFLEGRLNRYGEVILAEAVDPCKLQSLIYFD